MTATWKDPTVPMILAQFYAGDRLTGVDAPTAPPTPDATLWVDASTGNDLLTRAQVRAGGGALAWETIERAAWGSNDRDNPLPGEAADAGDVVAIRGGSSLGSPVLYTTLASVDDNLSPVYNPANSGTAGNPITFVAEGYVQLGAPAANAPVVGMFDRDYVKWYADRATGRFLIVCDPRGAITVDVKADSSVVNTRPDTGPVFVDGTGGWIEGFDIDGGFPIDYSDNWNGVRLQSATNCTIRNNYIHDFRRREPEAGSENTGHNQSGITSYGAAGCLIEHNVLENNGAGYYFKDQGTTYQPQQNNTVRYNWISSPAVTAAGLAPEGITWSITAINNGPNDIYQNVLVDLVFAFFIASQAPADDVYNNTVARTPYGFYGPFGGHTMRCWNNIFSVTTTAIYQDSATVPADTATDFEHNLYHGFGANTFMQDNTGNHTFAAWLAEYPSQDQAAPASINADPLFTNAAADDFTLQGGSPARNLGRHPDTAAVLHAGAYPADSGNPVIGLDS
jgi:hypothetical protein